ncbi:MAG: hypothetical protein KBT03_08010 [Bacteroidales bacterium]|nr:hypothetical protein [Candidatus Scybalousia scybalohippi]
MKGFCKPIAADAVISLKTDGCELFISLNSKQKWEYSIVDDVYRVSYKNVIITIDKEKFDQWFHTI